MKTLLDFGTHFGEGLSYFVDHYGCDNGWCIRSYEITPASAKLAKFCVDTMPRFKTCSEAIQIFSKGVSNETAYKRLFVHEVCETGEGNNILLDDRTDVSIDGHRMRSHGLASVIDVEDIISEVVEDGSTEIYIKMDIEGSEFDVLPKLLSSKHVGIIKEIHIEWHDRFFDDTDQYVKLKEEIIGKSSNLGIQIKEMVDPIIDTDQYYQEMMSRLQSAHNGEHR